MTKPKSKKKNSRNGSSRSLVPISRNPDGLANKIYRMVRWTNYSTFTNSITLDTIYAQSFKLSDLPDYADFTAAFDQYRIIQVDIWMVPTIMVNTTSVTNLGVLWTVIDYDDATAPGTNFIYTLQQYQNAQVHANDGKVKIRSFHPRIAVGLYSGAFTSFGNLGAETWIDAASPSVQYYGFKAAMSTGSGATLTYYVAAKFIVEFRNPR